MPDSERSTPSPKKQTDLSIWMALVIVGCGVIYATSVAIGLMPSRSSVLRSSHQDTASALPNRSSDKTITSVTAPSSSEQDPQQLADRGHRRDAIAHDRASTTPNLVPLSAPPLLDPELTPRNELAAQDSNASSSLSVARAPATVAPPDSQSISQKYPASQELGAPETTSGLPAATKPSLKSSSASGTASTRPASTHGLAAPGDYAQDTSGAIPQKKRAPSQASQKMWYK
jgi:hypothetical protein